LSKLGGPGLRQDGRFHALLGVLDRLDHGWSPKACSMVLNSMGRMGLSASPPLLRRLRDRLFDDMAMLPFPQALQPRHLSLSLNGFLHQNYDPGAPFLRRVLAVSRNRAEAFSTQELSTLLHCLGRLRPSSANPSAAMSEEADSRVDGGVQELEAVFVARLPEATVRAELFEEKKSSATQRFSRMLVSSRLSRRFPNPAHHPRVPASSHLSLRLLALSNLCRRRTWPTASSGWASCSPPPRPHRP
jgi:hypothetical protein